jgi:Bacterial regulatory proteins, luxR family
MPQCQRKGRGSGVGGRGLVASARGPVTEGTPNPAIVTQLGLSVKTVANYVSNIRGKLQVADRAQALARDAGLS